MTSALAMCHLTNWCVVLVVVVAVVVVVYCAFRYYFKRACNDFNCGFVYEELTDDDAQLPMIDSKICAKVVRMSWYITQHNVIYIYRLISVSSPVIISSLCWSIESRMFRDSGDSCIVLVELIRMQRCKHWIASFDMSVAIFVLGRAWAVWSNWVAGGIDCEYWISFVK